MDISQKKYRIGALLLRLVGAISLFFWGFAFVLIPMCIGAGALTYDHIVLNQGNNHTFINATQSDVQKMDLISMTVYGYSGMDEAQKDLIAITAFAIIVSLIVCVVGVCLASVLIMYESYDRNDFFLFTSSFMQGWITFYTITTVVVIIVGTYSNHVGIAGATVAGFLIATIPVVLETRKTKAKLKQQNVASQGMAPIGEQPTAEDNL